MFFVSVIFCLAAVIVFGDKCQEMLKGESYKTYSDDAIDKLCFSSELLNEIGLEVNIYKESYDLIEKWQ